VPGDTGSYSGTVGYTDVRITTAAGSVERRVQQAETRSAWVVTDEEHDEKFLACATYVLPDADSRELLAGLRGMAAVDDVAPTVASLGRSVVRQPA
jgi:hypothetical protein